MRKSDTITLGILAAVVALGCCCCCANWADDDDPNQPHHGHSGGRIGYFFFGGSSHPGAPVGTGTTGTSRGGFGTTAGPGTGVGHPGVGA